MTAKDDIKNFTLEELKKAMDEIKEPSYRARQIFFWLYKKGVNDFDEMNNIPKALSDKLSRCYYIGALALSGHLKSGDRTEKFLFKLSDGNFIESVLIYARDRKTICLSTQVGCRFRCSFCASGMRGFVRNLNASEIMNQALFLQHNLKYKITNFVFMGMGEPLDNCANLLKALAIMNHSDGMNIGIRRITVSTCGIIPGIEKLKNFIPPTNLSISLHATNNKIRNSLIPINKQYPLEKLIETCEDFINKKGRMITLEYLLLKDLNDSVKDAAGLAMIAKKLHAKVNLIPYSPVSNLDFKPTSKKNTDIFMKELIKRKARVSLRESKGKDIQAACGQLAGRIRESG